MSDGFFVAELAPGLKPGDQVSLTGPEARHAGVVRRLRPGETVVLTDGTGRGITGSVATVGPDQVTVTLTAWLDQPERYPIITIVQALPKKDRADLAIDLMTEVGVDRIVPWQAARCVSRWSPDKAVAGRAKWQAVAREASKQARRLRFPVVEPLATTAEVIDLIRAVPVALVAHEQAVTPLDGDEAGQIERCLIVIGPEGGLTADEVAAFQAAGAQTYSLGPTVLRTSTAGAIAIAQLRALWQAAPARRPR